MEESIRISGLVCKEPKIRISPFGFLICDFILAIKNKDSFEYIPCRYTGSELYQLKEGDSVKLKGNFKDVFADGESMHIFYITKANKKGRL